MRLPWPRAALVALDACLLSAAYVLAYWLRLGWDGAFPFGPTIARTLPVVVVVSLAVHAWNGLYAGILRYAGLQTAAAVLRSTVLSVLLSCLVLFLLFRLDGVPRSVFVIHGMAAVLLTGGARLGVRLLASGRRVEEGARRVLLYGDGDAAALVLEGLGRSPGLGYAIVGLLDADRRTHGREIRGVKVHGGPEALEAAARSTRAEELWVTMPDVAGGKLRAIYAAASALHLRVKVLPRLDHVLLGDDLARLQEPNIADLLRRPSRSLDREAMRRWLEGRRVLVTGAGGSIGSELVRQVVELRPAALALCDLSENNLFHIHRRLGERNGTTRVTPYLTDIRDALAVERMFAGARPEVIFHAAAFKHVPLVELHPCEGILTNVQGLVNVALAARAHGADKVVFISTDKAVRPANVMGATKRLGEIAIQVLDRQAFELQGGTRLSAVRFGNVLGSSGSVVPIFQEQIRNGGPVTVTHPDMTRFFMLASEAAELVIQAGAMGAGGEVFVLDMGEPVRIADMARDLIWLMGKEPDREVRLEYCGLRPGERIHEELLIRSSGEMTHCKDIWIDGARPAATDWTVLAARLEDLFAAARRGEKTAALGVLKELVPEFEAAYEDTRKAIRGVTPRLPALDGGAPGRAPEPDAAAIAPRVLS